MPFTHPTGSTPWPTGPAGSSSQGRSSRDRLARPHRRHHPALRPVVGVVQQPRGGVEGRRVEPPAVDHTIAHLGEEQPELQRPAIPAADVLHVGLRLGPPRPSLLTMLGSVRPMSQSTLLACPTRSGPSRWSLQRRPVLHADTLVLWSPDRGGAALGARPDSMMTVCRSAHGRCVAGHTRLLAERLTMSCSTDSEDGNAQLKEARHEANRPGPYPCGVPRTTAPEPVRRKHAARSAGCRS